MNELYDLPIQFEYGNTEATMEVTITSILPTTTFNIRLGKLLNHYRMARDPATMGERLFLDAEEVTTPNFHVEFEVFASVKCLVRQLVDAHPHFQGKICIGENSWNL